eukprot:128476_1
MSATDVIRNNVSHYTALHYQHCLPSPLPLQPSLPLPLPSPSPSPSSSMVQPKIWATLPALSPSFISSSCSSVNWFTSLFLANFFSNAVIVVVPSALFTTTRCLIYHDNS